VIIHHVLRSTEHDVLVVFNRSQKTIQRIGFTFAGEACTRPYKPGWPYQSREKLGISPGSHASVSIPTKVVDGVAARSAASCGRVIPTTIAVTDVRFTDGSTWDLGDRVRAGESYEAD